MDRLPHWRLLPLFHRRSGVRFRDAVPTRHDRRELRHGMRQVLRAIRAEHARAVDRLLQRLARRHSAVARIGQDVAKSHLVVEFVDGTVLDLKIRDTSFDLDRLSSRLGVPIAWLEATEPCLGHGWYRLHFVAVGHQQLDVLARVSWPGAESAFGRPEER